MGKANLASMGSDVMIHKMHTGLEHWLKIAKKQMAFYEESGDENAIRAGRQSIESIQAQMHELEKLMLEGLENINDDSKE